MAEFMDRYLKLGTFEILKGSGSISHEQAIERAEKEFEKYRVLQDREFISDFDRETRKYLNGMKGRKIKRK